MAQKRKKTPSRLSCALCGTADARLTMCESGYVCEPCCDQVRDGRDNTTRALKSQQRALEGQAQATRIRHNGGEVDAELAYRIAASDLMVQEAALMTQKVVPMGAGGEFLPMDKLDLIDTMAAPGAAALDASYHRLELISSMGTNVAAMALDAADTIQASNSLEKMLAHQMAILHQAVVKTMDKASFEPDQYQSIRMMSVAARLMDTYQRGMLTLKRLRSNGDQHITIQHVSVEDGGQAVIGSVKTGGAESNEQKPHASLVRSLQPHHRTTLQEPSHGQQPMSDARRKKHRQAIDNWPLHAGRQSRAQKGAGSDARNT